MSRGLTNLGVWWIVAITGTLCCGQPAPQRPPDVILISIDTVRRDAVGVMQSDRPSSTPALDGLAADGVVFANTFVPMPFTLSAHMSMLTSLHPEVHGVIGAERRLPAGIATLPEQLHAIGYRTIGLVTNEWLKGDFGFARGFDHYETLPHALTYADRVTAAALDLPPWEDPQRPPVFLFLHYMDAHSDFFHVGQSPLPYYSPTPFRTDIEVGDEEFCNPGGRCATDFLLDANRQHPPLSPATLAKLRLLYERGVQYLDTQLALLFAGLRAAGIYDSALIALVSDHGEAFREHGQFIHAQTYDETIAVPFILKLPAGEGAGRKLSTLAEIGDLAPTILELLGQPPLPGAQGTSLLPALRGQGGGKRYVLSQHKNIHSRYALRTTRWKLIFDEASGAAELYDLVEDPGEQHNVATQEPARVEALRDQLERILAALRDKRTALEQGAPVPPTSILDDEERERLKSLGYLDP